MVNKNVDIYKLVEEVNKRDTNKDIDDIYSMLDDLKDVEVAEVKKKVSSMNPETNTTLKGKGVSGSSTVKRPNVPEINKDFESRYEYFMELVRRVDYGIENSSDYVKGHKAALKKYLNEANNNPKSLYLVEASVNDEINKSSSNGSIFDKGYNDGLSYIYQALRKSKLSMIEKIRQAIKVNL